MTGSSRGEATTGLLRAFAAQLRSDLRLRLDEATSVQLPSDPPAARAGASLAALVGDSAPQGAEILLSIARPVVPVARVEACVVVARWQVRSSRLVPSVVVPIDDAALGPDRLVASSQAAETIRRFAAAGFDATLVPVPGEDEVRFEATRR